MKAEEKVERLHSQLKESLTPYEYVSLFRLMIEHVNQLYRKVDGINENDNRKSQNHAGR